MDKAAIVKKVDEFRNRGASLDVACKKAGIKTNAYYWAKKTIGKTVDAPKTEKASPEIVPNLNKCALVVGSPSAIAQVLSQMMN